VTKPAKEFTDTMGRRRVKGNMDIELTVDAMELAPHLDQVVLLSGDGDFRRLVEALQRKGLRVTVVSTVTTQPPMVSDDLRRQADEFLDLASLQSRVGREMGDRPMREPYQSRNLREMAEPSEMPGFVQRAPRRVGPGPDEA
jgi:uncharacterized LabA/DUF88 family protein